ncbi:GSCFA domain-containing protein [Pontibacter vulgaris]|uniref:GSCFA domain-containing protein n=1 Tax=Pontibacter vulgaris TaxID=2905679 RepID=UPI001FA74B03|nr:GSCFA domain-containing protein [Pontibacter vulgaris]
MFRTEVNVSPASLALGLQSNVLTFGSCFAEVIGNKLLQNKARALVNPFGTLFNPISVCKLLQAAAGQPYNFEEHLVQHNGIWYVYDLHSSLSSPDKEELTELIRQRLQQTEQQLQQASLLIITLGTAVSYKLIKTGAIVANCHKLPASNFNRELLSITEISTAFESLLAVLNQVNPNLKVLLTVSPVRHIKETIEINSVSKSILRVACHQLKQTHDHVLYFPAYEIMMDDLRDYRFYKPDMLHPTEVAEDYIWQKFTKAYFSKEFQEFLPEWEKMLRAVAHRPFHPDTPAHQAFLQNTIAQLRQLELKYKIDASAEQQQLQAQLQQV